MTDHGQTHLPFQVECHDSFLSQEMLVGAFC